jgi:hypothetical protein
VGDLDQFQWRDPADQTDYLFWAEIDDGQFCYARPDEIASGRQHFDSVQFLLNIARTPHPAHVLQEMPRAAEAFALQLDCQLISMIDRTPADGHGRPMGWRKTSGALPSSLAASSAAFACVGRSTNRLGFWSVTFFSG